MNILMISHMYPAYQDQVSEEISYAVHDFAKEWNSSENVLAVKPYFLFKKKLFKNIRESVDFVDSVKVVNFPILLVPFTSYFYCNPLLRFLQKERFTPDVIVAHMSSCIIWANKLAEHYKVPLICGIHGSDVLELSGKSKTTRKFRRVLDSASGIACRSYMIYRKFISMFPHFKEKCFVAYSGIEKELIEDTEFCVEKMKKWRGTRKVNFITVSLLQKLKNIDVNLRVLSKLPSSINWTYTHIGDGGEESYLKNLAREQKIDDKVVFLGRKSRKEVIAELKKRDIFIMVSAPETFGLAYLEAMAKGNIVIGAKEWGIDGVIKNYVNGFLCTPRDEEELLNVLLDIISRLDESRLEEIIKCGNEAIMNLTVEKAAENYLNNILRIQEKSEALVNEHLQRRSA